MPIHVLTASSPYVHVEILTPTASTTAIALCDTGASITAFHPKFIEAMEPQQLGVVDSKIVEGRMEVENTYYFQIVLEPEMHDQPRGFAVEVVSREPASPCDILIGRDLMSRWMIAIDGPGDRLIISNGGEPPSDGPRASGEYTSCRPLMQNLPIQAGFSVAGR